MKLFTVIDVDHTRQPPMGQSRFCASHRSLGRTACESISETESAEGDSNDRLNPATARVATSMASVSHGRPIERPLLAIHCHDVHQCVVDLDEVHGEVGA